MSDEEYDLAESKKKLGALIPIIKDAHGHVIDGFHRLDADPDWPSVTLDHIQDSAQLSIARLAANVCRRQVGAEEKSRLLGEIAKLTGWTPKQIAENLGMSYQWVMKYLPDEYKERPGAGPKEGSVSRRGTQSPRVEAPIQTESIPDAPQTKEPVVCSNEDCQVGTWFPYRLKDGRVLCRHCFEELWKQGKVTKHDLLQERKIDEPSLPDGYVRAEELLEEPAEAPATSDIEGEVHEEPEQLSEPIEYEPLRKTESEEIEQAPSDSIEGKPTKTERRLKVTVTMEPFSFYEKSAEPLSKDKLMPKIVDFVKSRSLDEKFHITIEEEDTEN